MPDSHGIVPMGFRKSDDFSRWASADGLPIARAADVDGGGHGFKRCIVRRAVWNSAFFLGDRDTRRVNGTL
jgi:hypothetical protein